jgi:hypothetical protein
MTTYLSNLKSELANLKADLDRMPAHKFGSRWHLDRLAEANRLETKIARLEAK